MKQFIISLFLYMSPLLIFGQTSDSKGKLGFALNSGLNGEIYPFRLVPSISLHKNKNQYELGVGFNPIVRNDQKILSGEFNYKHFPNGVDNKLNMYILTQLSYVNNKRNTYYSSNYNYLFLNGGYGFIINPFKGAYLGTNVSVGSYTYAKNSENPYKSHSTMKLFKEYGFNLAFQFNVGYRL